MALARAITDVQSDIQKLNTLWATATTQYAARKASLASEIDNYVATHQTAASAHNLEVEAATALKATIVPVAAAVETAASEANTFLLTQPWYQRLVAFFKRNWRWVAYGVAVLGMLYIGVHLHK